MRSASRSARPDSLSPHVRSVRLTITAGRPPAAQVGQDRPLDHLLHLVRHAGHGVDDLAVVGSPTGQISPGAVPGSAG